MEEWLMKDTHNPLHKDSIHGTPTTSETIFGRQNMNE
jgi:hypothetical protein